jgi:hypothetical protein
MKKKIADIGWAVRITRLPKRVWISIDGRVEFDNEEDCNAYNNEYLQQEQEMEEEKEENSGWTNNIVDEMSLIGRMIQTMTDFC